MQNTAFLQSWLVRPFVCNVQLLLLILEFQKAQQFYKKPVCPVTLCLKHQFVFFSIPLAQNVSNKENLLNTHTLTYEYANTYIHPHTHTNTQIHTFTPTHTPATHFSMHQTLHTHTHTLLCAHFPHTHFITAESVHCKVYARESVL